MAQIHVHPPTLAAAADKMSGALAAGDELVATRGSLTASAGAAGRGDVAAAIDQFLNNWATALQLTNENARTIASLLRQAADAYAGIESDITKGAT